MSTVTPFHRRGHSEATETPHDHDAERSVLGAILLRNDAFAVASARIERDDFQRDAHRFIFDAIVALNERGSAIDLVTLKEALTRAGRLEDVGGVAELARLVDGVPRSSNVEHYAAIVAEHAKTRQLIATADAIKLRASAGDLDGAYEAFAGGFADLTVVTAHSRNVARAAAQERIRREARRAVDAEERGPSPTPEGSRLDAWLAEPDPEIRYRIDGWFPAGGRVVLAAEYKAGKTTLIGNLLRSVVDGDPWLGRHGVGPIAGKAVLLDFEMSGPMLKRWLRDQAIERTDRVVVYPLRGKAAAFDITNAKVRAEWATRLRDCGAAFLVVDCLKPILDALNLDEKDSIGTFTSGLDALLVEAGIPECLLVQHMGHVGERARGDSSLLGWPEANWTLVRENDDPASQRFIKAYGRDIDIPESRLDYAPTTRRLNIAGGSRREEARERREEARSTGTADAVDAIRNVLQQLGSLSGRKVKEEMKTRGLGRNLTERALTQGVADGRLVVATGGRNSDVYSLP